MESYNIKGCDNQQQVCDKILQPDKGVIAKI